MLECRINPNTFFNKNQLTSLSTRCNIVNGHDNDFNDIIFISKLFTKRFLEKKKKRLQIHPQNQQTPHHLQKKFIFLV